jgi:hypothetical protein
VKVPPGGVGDVELCDTYDEASDRRYVYEELLRKWRLKDEWEVVIEPRFYVSSKLSKYLTRRWLRNWAVVIRPTTTHEEHHGNENRDPPA